MKTLDEISEKLIKSGFSCGKGKPCHCAKSKVQARKEIIARVVGMLPSWEQLQLLILVDYRIQFLDGALYQKKLIGNKLKEIQANQDLAEKVIAEIKAKLKGE